MLPARPPRLLLPGRPALLAAWDAAWRAAMAEPAQTTQEAACHAAMRARLGGGPASMAALDAVYTRQERDGAIPARPDGAATPDAGDYTHPPILSWIEWDYFTATGDASRLRRVFPHLALYFNWYLKNRTRPAGGFWWSAAATGMPAVERPGAHAWIDYTALAALDCEHLALIALEIGNNRVASKCAAKYLELKELVNEHFWDEAAGCYTDRDAKGRTTGQPHLGAYWALLAGLATPSRASRMVGSLESFGAFRRLYGMPALPHGAPGYDPRAGVLPGMVVMVCRGLERLGAHAQAHEIALAHVTQAARLLERTETLWAEHAPDIDEPAPGSQGGPAALLAPTVLLLDHVMGVRVDALLGEVTWRLFLDEEIGVEDLAVGPVRARLHATWERGRREVTVEADGGLTVLLHGPAASRIVELPRAGGRRSIPLMG